MAVRTPKKPTGLRPQTPCAPTSRRHVDKGASAGSGQAAALALGSVSRRLAFSSLNISRPAGTPPRLQEEQADDEEPSPSPLKRKATRIEATKTKVTKTKVPPTKVSKTKEDSRRPSSSASDST